MFTMPVGNVITRQSFRWIVTSGLLSGMFAVAVTADSLPVDPVDAAEAETNAQPTDANGGVTILPGQAPVSYWAELGNMNVRFGYLTEAISAFERALAVAEYPEEQGRISFSLGQALLRDQRFVRAAASFQEAIEAMPNDVPFVCKSHTFRAQALLRAGNPAAAEDSLRFVMVHSDNEWERNHARDQLFSLLAQSGRADELTAMVEEGFEGDRDSPDFLMELAAAHAAHEDGIDDALDLYLQVLDKEPGRRDALERAIGMYRVTGRFKDAILLIEQLIGEADEDRQLELAERAATLARMGGDLTAALHWRQQITDQTPDEPHAWLRLAETQTAAGRREQAIDSYLRAIEQARSPLERDQYTIFLIREQIRAGDAEAAEAAMRRLSNDGSSREVQNEARSMLFEWYAQQDRLGEVIFPNENP